MENNNVINNEELRNDLIDQISEGADESVPSDPDMVSENGSGLNAGAIGGGLALAAGIGTGIYFFVKKKVKNAGSVKQFAENKKHEHEFRKEKRSILKDVTPEELEQIKQARKENEDKRSGTPVTTEVETKKTSKK